MLAGTRVSHVVQATGANKPVPKTRPANGYNSFIYRLFLLNFLRPGTRLPRSRPSLPLPSRAVAATLTKPRWVP